MKYKIKCRPEDFIVDEISDLPLAKKGPFAAYRLKKKNWNTSGVLLELAKKFRRSADTFSYGGKKDRDGITTQTIAFEGSQAQDLEGIGYSLKFLGFMERPMGPDLVRSNRFSIVVRGIEKEAADRALQEAAVVRENGFPNYFDDPRFGSYDVTQGFLAEKLLKDQQNGAAKIYLTAIGEDDNEEAIVRKTEFFKRWKDWKACLEVAKTNTEKTAFHFFIAKRTGLLDFLRDIPKSELSMYISSYQAFIWNEMLRRILKDKIHSKLNSCPGKAGEYLFYERLSSSERSYLLSLKYPTASSKASMPDELTERAYREVFIENGIDKVMFNKLKVRQSYFKATEREAAAMPIDLTAEKAPDELEEGSEKMTLRFSLIRGGYGTMLLKRIFVDP
ncbi:MAG TPA: tRNA pseudouridine(13) synthase TruD [Candidatus Omnitrophota bacterium]|nr:tRNA pseudouridine(13) synthase TruD [Candidatus Omnitrophota bacterium]